jgi:hypothetical protein
METISSTTSRRSPWPGIDDAIDQSVWPGATVTLTYGVGTAALSGPAEAWVNKDAPERSSMERDATTATLVTNRPRAVRRTGVGRVVLAEAGAWLTSDGLMASVDIVLSRYF